MTISLMKANHSDKQRSNIIQWGMISVALLGAILIHRYYLPQTLLWQWGMWILVSVFVLGLAATTEKGQHFLNFAKEARLELRKVVWPTRQETLRISIIVVLVVLAVSFILWGLDAALFSLIGKLTH